MTLAGDLDGLAQVTRIAEDYIVPEELLAAGDEAAAVQDKPVLVFVGMNHAQMGNGYETEALIESDFKAEISLEDATDLLATHAAAFLDMHRSTDDAVVAAAYALVRDRLFATDEIVRFFLDAQRADAAGSWCYQGQRLVANLNTDVAGRLDVDVVAYTDFDLFLESKPSIVANGTSALATSTAYLEPPAGVIPTSDDAGIDSEGTYSLSFDCKFKSQEAVVRTLGLGEGQYGPAGTCQTFTAFVAQLAASAVGPASVARFAATGKPIVAQPDVVYSQGNEWSVAVTTYNETADALFVSGASLQTAYGIPVLGGMTYCKALPAAKAVAWVLHDGLPRGLGSVHRHQDA